MGLYGGIRIILLVYIHDPSTSDTRPETCSPLGSLILATGSPALEKSFVYSHPAVSRAGVACCSRVSAAPRLPAY